MKLDAFIASALKDVASGVISARNDSPENTGISVTHQFLEVGINVAFDIAVSTESKDGAEQLCVEKPTGQSGESRMSFTIPVFPMSKRPQKPLG